MPFHNLSMSSSGTNCLWVSHRDRACSPCSRVWKSVEPRARANLLLPALRASCCSGCSGCCRLCCFCLPEEGGALGNCSSRGLECLSLRFLLRLSPSGGPACDILGWEFRLLLLLLLLAVAAACCTSTTTDHQRQ